MNLEFNRALGTTEGTIAEGNDPRFDPTSPASDGLEYYVKVVNGVKSWEQIIDTNGTAISEKTKLQAGGAGDWVNGSYVGATSGATTGTKGGERFTGQDVTNSNYYRYECIANNNWIRSLIS